MGYHMINIIKSYIRDRSGAAAAEYALILAIVGAGIAVAAGSWVQPSRLRSTRHDRHLKGLRTQCFRKLPAACLFEGLLRLCSNNGVHMCIIVNLRP